MKCQVYCCQADPLSPACSSRNSRSLSGIACLVFSRCICKNTGDHLYFGIISRDAVLLDSRCNSRMFLQQKRASSESDGLMVLVHSFANSIPGSGGQMAFSDPFDVRNGRIHGFAMVNVEHESLPKWGGTLTPSSLPPAAELRLGTDHGSSSLPHVRRWYVDHRGKSSVQNHKAQISILRFRTGAGSHHLDARKCILPGRLDPPRDTAITKSSCH